MFVRLLLALAISASPAAAAPAAASPAESLTLTGRVLDAQSGQAIADAHVTVIRPRLETATTDRGEFSFAGLPEGAYEVEVSRLGYTTQRLSVVLDATAAPLEFRLELRPLLGPQVEVTATRAEERESAVAFTELDRKQIARRYWAQDVPMLLAETPGVYAYSDAGNGIGYSYVKIRGFAQRRVAVMINGVPLNDPQSHEVYWVDHPDLLATTQELQVQRGVGSAIYGAAAVGGSINLETLGGPSPRRLAVEAGGGTLGTTRFSLQFESGLLDNTYEVMGRYSRIQSDGYRDQSWSDLWSYYLSASRYDPWITTQVNVYGGLEQLHLAYYGVDQSYLNGEVTGDADTDRRYNPLTWADETDNYFERRYELINNVKLSERASLTSTIFYAPGEGYYDDFPYGPQTFASRRLPDFTVDSNTLYPASYYADTSGAGPYTVVASDMTQSLWVENTHYGWIPRAKFRQSRGELIVGAEWREHEGQHYGDLTWAAALPPGAEPNHLFYDYTGRVGVLSAYAQEGYELKPDLRLTGSLQWRGVKYSIGDDAFNDYDFELEYSFLNPRVGLNWNASPRWNLFGSYAYMQVEPLLSEIYRADDPTSVPLFGTLDPANGVYEDPLVVPEDLNDWEAGIGYTSGDTRVRLTGYYLDFQNEIVPSGQLGPLGVPITGNAASSYHAGGELEFGVPLGRGFSLSGNVSVSDNRFRNYEEYVDSTTVINYDGNAIAGFPGTMANVTLGYQRGAVQVSATLVDVGLQYLDNTEDNRKNPYLKDVPGYQHKYIPEHATLNAWLSLDLDALTRSRPLGAGSLSLDVHAQNLTDLKYTTAGYVYADVPYFYVASGFNIFVSLKAAY
jgi:iron complex outermembrane receptor protein